MFRLELLQGAGLPRADFLSVSFQKKPKDLPKFVQSEMGSRIRRLRYFNDTIIALEEIWLDKAAGIVDPSGTVRLDVPILPEAAQYLDFSCRRLCDDWTRTIVGTRPILARKRLNDRIY